MPMNNRLLRPVSKPAPVSASSGITTESGVALKTESGDKIRTEQN
jgi:hypothetical protein